MANGQGAAMALPIYGRFMRKVYADPSLGLSQSKKFNFPADVNLCEKEFYEITEPDADSNAEEQSIEGVFD